MPTSSPSSPAAHAPISAASSAASAIIAPPQSAASTPSTIAITLVQAPTSKQSLWESGTVLVAFFALIGVLITVFAAHRRMRGELDAAAGRAKDERDQSREEAALDRSNAAQEAHLERIATARRAVYLQAVESLAKAQAFIGGLAAEDLTNLDTKGQIGPLSEAVGKIAVVGEMETVREARDLFMTTHRQLFEAMGCLIPLARYKADSAHHDGEWQLAQIEIQRLLGEMRKHNESGVKDAEAMKRLDSSFKIEQARAARAAEARHSANLKVNEMQMEHAARVLEFTEQIASRTNRLVDSIRRELGLATDLEAFQAQTLEMSQSMRTAHAELVARIGEETARANAES